MAKQVIRDKPLGEIVYTVGKDREGMLQIRQHRGKWWVYVGRWAAAGTGVATILMGVRGEFQTALLLGVINLVLFVGALRGEKPEQYIRKGEREEVE